MPIKKTSQPNLVEKLPAFLSSGFAGYEYFMDPTLLGFNKLTYPSKNCSVPNFDKIVPDMAKALLGQQAVRDAGIIGNQQKFKNLGGIEMEIRVDKSVGDATRDVISIFYANDKLLFGSLSGTFQLGETVTGGTSGATGQVSYILNTVLTLASITGTFQAGETVTGSSSLATATVISPPTSLWHSITESTNPLPVAPHEYYFDSFFDYKVPNTIPNSALSKNLQRAVWCNGYQNPSTKKGEVYSWTGGVGQIVSLVANTSISVDASTTWRSLGFTEDAAGAVNIVINGVAYNVPVPANIDTSTLNIASTAGVSVGDIVTSKIEIDVVPVPFDVCRANKGYMFYGNWNMRDLYMSNGVNVEYNYLLTGFQAVQNDLTFNTASIYTGLTDSKFHVVISSVTPAINQSTYVGTGPNDGNWITSGYTGTGSNTYKITVVSDVSIAFSGTPTGWVTGELVTGSTSKATARIFSPDSGGSDLFLISISGSFENGEAVTGQSSGTSGTVVSITYQATVQVFKNGVTFVPPGFSAALAYQLLVGPHPLIDGIVFNAGTTNTGDYWATHNVGDTFQLTIQTQLPDTFQWQKDGGPLSSPIAITGAFQALSDGLQVKLGQFGHAVGNFWDIAASPIVARAWANFYYSTPVRKPAQGYKYRLPSNFWTMDTQEDSMYVNGSYGEWSVIATILSADLQSETVSLEPLKNAGASKVLYPYLTGHLADDLVYITIDKNLDTLGRKPLLEKPQTGYLSDRVKLDFQRSSFVGGRIKYLNKKLYVSSPQESLMHQFDTFKDYWNPPKTYPEIGILSIFGNDLICHSEVRNQSFTVFGSDAGDNGSEYGVTVRTGFSDGGNKWKSKASNMSFTDGYIEGLPPITHTMVLGPSGCGGTYSHPLQPVICANSDRSPIGAGSLGSHPNGSDQFETGTYFQEVWPKYNRILMWYFLAIQLDCITKTHSYKYLSLGMNSTPSADGNNKLVPKANVS